jgi:predicted DNA-binding transcriptional regulator AlpA
MTPQESVATELRTLIDKKEKPMKANIGDSMQIPDLLAKGQETENRERAGELGSELAPKDRGNKQPTKLESLLIPDTVAAALAGIGRSTWWRLHAAGKTPAAIKIGRAVRWNRAEIVAWIEAGCPDRLTWEAGRETRRTHPRVSK